MLVTNMPLEHLVMLFLIWVFYFIIAHTKSFFLITFVEVQYINKFNQENPKSCSYNFTHPWVEFGCVDSFIIIPMLKNLFQKKHQLVDKSHFHSYNDSISLHCNHILLKKIFQHPYFNKPINIKIFIFNFIIHTNEMIDC